MSQMNKRLAAGASLVALGGIAGVAIAQPGHEATVKQAAAPVEVRTQTIRQTVHVTRRMKPKHRRVHRAAAPAIARRPPSPAAPAPAAPAAAASPPPVYRPPAPAPRPVTSVRTTAPSTHHPVTTRTSGGGSGGSGGGERENRHESEGGDD